MNTLQGRTMGNENAIFENDNPMISFEQVHYLKLKGNY